MVYIPMDYIEVNMRKLSLMLMFCVCLVGCGKQLVKVPRPIYPTMKPVVIEDGVIKGSNVDNVKYNILEMSKLIDTLWVLPCMEE